MSPGSVAQPLPGPRSLLTWPPAIPTALGSTCSSRAGPLPTPRRPLGCVTPSKAAAQARLGGAAPRSPAGGDQAEEDRPAHAAAGPAAHHPHHPRARLGALPTSPPDPGRQRGGGGLVPGPGVGGGGRAAGRAEGRRIPGETKALRDLRIPDKPRGEPPRSLAVRDGRR